MIISRTTTGPIARVLALATFLLVLTGCATGGYGPGTGAGYPGQGGYPGQHYPDTRSQSIVGTVDGIDIRGQRLILVTQPQPQQGSRGARVEVYFDRNTRLFYQGRQVAMEGLERGDVVRAEIAQSSGRLFARNVEVIHNVRDGRYGGQYGGGQQYGNELRGTVGFVDPRTRSIELQSRGYGGSYGAGSTRLRYDERTQVEYQGRRYRPEDLERGDQVRVQARRMGSNELLAERIIVERSARSR